MARAIIPLAAALGVDGAEEVESALAGAYAHLESAVGALKDVMDADDQDLARLRLMLNDLATIAGKMS